MSWSISAVGKPSAVLRDVQERAAALEAFPDGYAVMVEANGSQTTNLNDSSKFVNNLSLTIKPLYGFLDQ